MTPDDDHADDHRAVTESVVLEFNDVCFAYEREEVLHNIRLQILAGSLVAVVGPNGGGKSTLLKLGLGLLHPKRGRVRVLGRPPQRTRKRVGYVPQHVHFDPSFPVRAIDVVLMGRVERHRFGPFRRRDKRAAFRALEQVGMSPLAYRGFAQLSGGERQRVLIAQALVSEPVLLLLDEPTANVDTAVEHEIYELLRRLNAHMTIIAVSHNLNVVTRHASHIICVNRAASMMSLSDMSEGQLHAFHRGDMTVLQHMQSCHIIDPTPAMCESHRAGEDS